MDIRFRTITPTELGVEYWERTAGGEIPLRRCLACARHRLYLTAVCRDCGSTEWEWDAASGAGMVYAYTTVRYRLSDEFPDEYVIVLVDLPEGLRMMGNLLGDQEGLAIGAPVHAVFVDLADGKKLPQFVLTDRTDGQL